MSIYDKVSVNIMDKKIVNEEQFRKLVIKEAKKYLSEEEQAPSTVDNNPEPKRRVTFDKVESLIKEMEERNKSITSISLAIEPSDEVIEESKEDKPKRDLDVIEHNRMKNVKHVNEAEKDRWKRMLKYDIPSDEER